MGALVDGEMVRDVLHLAEIAERKPGRVDSELDVPVTPEFRSCCGSPLNGTFKFVELPRVDS